VVGFPKELTFCFQKANWRAFAAELNATEEDTMINNDINLYSESITNAILKAAINHIPNRNMPSHLLQNPARHQTCGPMRLTHLSLHIKKAVDPGKIKPHPKENCPFYFKPLPIIKKKKGKRILSSSRQGNRAAHQNPAAVPNINTSLSGHGSKPAPAKQ
jgi:hypothetical protein